MTGRVVVADHNRRVATQDVLVNAGLLVARDVIGLNNARGVGRIERIIVKHARPRLQSECGER